ncbi:hypothetical protein GCM10023311_22160 [Flaviramulus aquimarinus]|uniref:DUF4398 domain-containing protein n=2 Tax=Flaviramulus aquimarinus TaxID=1170456 RepID=A0ABP9FAI0_9FLAO
MASVAINAQTDCDVANSYLVNAYSHVKDAYDSNNISHLKYYANRSVESFKLSKETLITCGCKIALNLANKGIDLLAKVEYVETYEDGRFYVKRARDISKESVIEIDKCSLALYNNTANESKELSDLQHEQLALKQQQEALKLKEKQIKTKLAQQKEKALTLEKKQLIISYNNAITSNIKTYNDALKICDCSYETIENIISSEDMTSKSIADIRRFYTNNLKILASNYLSELNACH